MTGSVEASGDISSDTSVCTSSLGSAVDSRVLLGESLNFIAQQILSPVQRFSAWAMHSYTPIRPGEFGNHSSYVVEVASRISCCVLGCVFLPLLLTMWAAGGVIDKIGDVLTARSYTYWKGTSEKPESGKTHTFFSLNACMMWGMLPIVFGGVAAARERTDKIADLIIAQNADFVALQEVSFGPSMDLYEKLKSHYAHFYTRIGPNPGLNMESALFVASKYPIIGEPKFVAFPSSGAIKRGVFYFETASSWVLTTHLQPGTEKESGEVRQQQMAILSKIMNELKAKSNKPCVLLGDLNIARDGSNEDEYSKLHMAEHFYDAFAEKNPTVDAATTSCTEKLSDIRMGWESSKIPDALIDYILLDKASKDKVTVKTDLIDTYDMKDPEKALSDHKGIFSKIQFS